MTIISEQQAYLMGWVHRLESFPLESETNHIMSSSILTSIVSDDQIAGVPYTHLLNPIAV